MLIYVIIPTAREYALTAVCNARRREYIFKIIY